MTAQQATYGYSPNANFWIKIIRDRLDRYRSDLTDAAVLSAIGDPNGQKILDAGAGEGYLSRNLAQAGAEVTGIELSPELVTAAKDLENIQQDGVTYLQGSITEPLEVKDASFDTCVCNHVLNDIDDIESAFTQIGRALKPGGQLVALVLHPCFYWQRSGMDETDPEWPKRYFDLRQRMQSFNVAGIHSPSEIKVWHRPLESYASALTETGFVITNLTEPHPTDAHFEDPWWQENWSRPLFLIISAQLDQQQRASG